MSEQGKEVAGPWADWLAKGMLRKLLPPGFPTIVTLCGSTKFMTEFYDANMRETLAGKVVLTVGMSSHGDCQPTPEQKIALDELHKRKIDLSDEILVLSCPLPWCDHCGKFRHECYPCESAFTGTMRPYIGSSTRSEIEYAKSTGKTIRYLEPMEKPK